MSLSLNTCRIKFIVPLFPEKLEYNFISCIGQKNYLIANPSIPSNDYVFVL